MTNATALRWHTVTGHRDPKWYVKGTPLAQAIYGFQSRFAIVELRVGSGETFGVEFGIADATTVSDADRKAGKRPLIVKRYPTVEECMEAIDRASAKLEAEFDAAFDE